jgi:hypothetical protein
MAVKIRLRAGQTYEVTTCESKEAADHIQRLQAASNSRADTIQELLDELRDTRAAKKAADRETRAIILGNNEVAAENAALRKWRSAVTSAALHPDTGGITYEDVPERIRMFRRGWNGPNPGTVQGDLQYLARDRDREKRRADEVGAYNASLLKAVDEQSTRLVTAERRINTLADERDFLKRDRDRANARADAAEKRLEVAKKLLKSWADWSADVNDRVLEPLAQVFRR